MTVVLENKNATVFRQEKDLQIFTATFNLKMEKVGLSLDIRLNISSSTVSVNRMKNTQREHKKIPAEDDIV